MQLEMFPVSSGDEGFLIELYASTRAAELSLVPWTDEQKQAFIAHQFRAQSDHYLAAFPHGSFQVLYLDGERAGRLYTAELEDEIRIIDLTIESASRGCGFGTSILRGIIETATDKNKAVQIYLDADDRSSTLFHRLSFRPVSKTEVHVLWRWDGAVKTK